MKYNAHEKYVWKLQMLEKQAQKKYDELDAIWNQIAEVNRKIEEQREKQCMGARG